LIFVLAHCVCVLLERNSTTFDPLEKRCGVIGHTIASRGPIVAAGGTGINRVPLFHFECDTAKRIVQSLDLQLCDVAFRKRKRVAVVGPAADSAIRLFVPKSASQTHPKKRISDSEERLDDFQP
jgi:hypothetical protein